uniref:Serine aminopeptidase S33 domain-containing protein n=1 Tax=mine drainage metagenome TaxID=410659 RepID=E6PZ13_9ZZZZ
MLDVQFDPMRADPAFPNVPARWLLTAFAVVIAGVVGCAWLTLCLLYWQGSWQLLYHPQAKVTVTPAKVNLPFETVHFAATDEGVTQLTGWWIPSGMPGVPMTVLYLHGVDGNLGDTLPALSWLHQQGSNVFAIDYRGYGASAAAKPTEARMVEDVDWSLQWLIANKNLPPERIVVWGSGLGATLAAEAADEHSRLAGVVLDEPREDAMNAVFHDARSHLVPAHWLATDRFDLDVAARRLQVDSLWLLADGAAEPSAYQDVHVRKTAVWLKNPVEEDARAVAEWKRWLDGLSTR